MAKKKNENTLSYMQMPLPEGGKSSRMVKIDFGGLNKRNTVDSGSLSAESNISTQEYPYLTPSPKHTAVYGEYKKPIDMFGFGDFLLVVYEESDCIKIDYIKGTSSNDAVYYTGVLKHGDITDEDRVKRSIVQFNVYDTPTDPLTGQYVKKLLIFPDKCSMFMNIVEAESNPEGWDADDLSAKDLSVMYHYEGKFYTVALVQKTKGDDGYDKDKVSYKKVLRKKHEITKQDEAGNEETITLNGEFLCDGMEVVVKEFKPTDKSDTPPDTASHNYYYRNSETSEVYRWVDDESDSDNSGWKVSIPPAVPSLKYATVHLSRVFGVDDDRVYASGFNDYANWNLDTIDEYNEANAWCSPSQSNTKASGKFTGITTYQNHVVCFKQDFMHEIYNTKNPFRLQDIYAEGAIDNRTIQDVDGKLIFVSDDNVKIYTGSNPRIISYNLDWKKPEYAVSGTDGRNYYLFLGYNDAFGEFSASELFVYDTYTELWSERSIDQRVLNFAHNKNGVYMLCGDGTVYSLPNGSNARAYRNQPWMFETELITKNTANIKHIKKLQMLVELASTANFKVYILYDDEEFNESTSHLVYSSTKTGKYPIRVKPRKTANYGFKLHVEGVGYAKLYELEIFIEAGGDLYV